MSVHRCVVAGAMALDMAPVFPEGSATVADIMSEGKAVYIDDISFVLGGCVSNTGVAMHRLGVDTELVSKVGDDPLGNVVRELMAAENVNGHFSTTSGKNTTTTIVVVPEGTDRTFWHRRGASQEFCFADLPADVMNNASLFHFGYPTGMKCMYSDGGDNLLDIYSRVKQEYGMTTSMDLSLPGFASDAGRADWKRILYRVLPYVDIFLPSLEEMMFIFRREEYLKVLEKSKGKDAVDYIDLSVLEDLSQEMLSLGVKIFGLKMGKKGLYLRTADREHFAGFGKLEAAIDDRWYSRELFDTPYVPKQYVSTTGAGDSAIAGILAGIMDGLGPEDALHLGGATATTRIESHEAVHSIRPKDEIINRINSGWEKMQLEEKDLFNWKADPATRTYVGKNDAYLR